MTDYVKPEDRRYLGKIRSNEGKYGSYKSISLDNHASDNPRNEGALVWMDKKTGQSFQVKTISIKGVSDASKERGWENSICIDLDNRYQVDNLSEPNKETPKKAYKVPQEDIKVEKPKPSKGEVSSVLSKYGLA